MKKSQNLFKKSDLLLFISVLLVSLGLMALTLLPKPAGKRAVVKQNGETVGEYGLYEDVEVCFSSETGGHNLLVIEDGCAYIKDASCPDKLCMHSGRISESSETLICLPNRLSVVILE